MSIKKLDDGQYQVDVRPKGSEGRRYRRKFSTKREATAYERHIQAQAHNRAWIEKSSDKRKLSEAISLWWRYHGQLLKEGAQSKKKLENLSQRMNNPMLCQVTKKQIIDYRSDRLSSGISPRTINKEVALLSGVFTQMINAEEYHHEHPIIGLRKLKERRQEMAFLSSSEISFLLQHASGDMKKIAKICLATGARWNEANDLRAENVTPYRVTFVATKNGNNRTTPISKELFDEISSEKSGRLFTPCYDKFYLFFKSLNFNLPKGQAVHVLRHTFASHFMQNGGNILTLQKALGHATIQQTMEYAHFSPDYLQDVVALNPLNERP